MHTSGTMIPTSSVLTFPVKNCFLQRNRFSVSVYESYKHKLIIWKIFEYCLSSTSLWYMYVFSIYQFVRWYFGLNLWRLQFKYVQCIFLPNDCTSYEWRMETYYFLGTHSLPVQLCRKPWFTVLIYITRTCAFNKMFFQLLRTTNYLTRHFANYNETNRIRWWLIYFEIRQH